MTLECSSRTQIHIGIALVLLLAASRGYHAEVLSHLPSASWAVFFLAGVYLTPWWSFPVLFAEAVLLDYWAVTWRGVDTFCITSAYAFLLPAYAALWYSGRWFINAPGTIPTLSLRLPVSVCVAAALCEALTSGSFYFLSGRFDHPTLEAFAVRFSTYFPSSLLALVFYVGLAIIVHVMFTIGHRIPSIVGRLRASN
ncbi:MAG: hypothetical protein GDA68_02980 [Nitrospira sp. CR2.1]|nr:hypothetical protein [Nitrospira sp. CR2.1]